MSMLLPRLPLFVLLLLSSCGTETQEHDGQVDAGPRIASMSPALTAMLVELGLEHRLVGRSSFCMDIDEALPVVGNLHDVHWEALARAKPTHVLVQGRPGLVDPGIVQVTGERGWNLLVYPLVDAPDIKSAMTMLPADLDLDDTEADIAARRALDFVLRVDEAMSTPVDGAVGQKILLLTPGDQMLGWGKSTYLSSIMEQLGAVNVLVFDGWRHLGAEEIVRSDVDRIILASSTPQEESWGLRELFQDTNSPPRIDALVHPGLEIPSSQLPEIIEAMRATLSSSADTGSIP